MFLVHNHIGVNRRAVDSHKKRVPAHSPYDGGVALFSINKWPYLRLTKTQGESVNQLLNHPLVSLDFGRRFCSLWARRVRFASDQSRPKPFRRSDGSEGLEHLSDWLEYGGEALGQC